MGKSDKKKFDTIGIKSDIQNLNPTDLHTCIRKILEHRKFLPNQDKFKKYSSIS